MNTQNVEFLKRTLLNLGFGEKMNNELEKQINGQVPEFKLGLTHEFNQKQVDYTLHFKAGDNQDMYFFNKYDASIKSGDKENDQTFYINKGNGVTVKEAFNLMEGRSVNKVLYNAEGQKYNAWLQLDKDNLTEGGNRKIKHFHENYGYDVEKVIAGKGIKEMATTEGRDNLLRSLKKGNAQQITVEREGKDQKFFITANPQFKTVDLFDSQMKKIKREELLSPESATKQQTKQGKQQKEVLPEKKQRNSAKLKV